ncbi:SGNH/GDSL hydrolase family protein [Paenibacillus pasadenensis]|uniref:SGNH/GDSL hydrolase family protein n=1 Tax=Paenibacillus pasadenensis TaxID=217090 RepID=UPI00203E2C2A|nr:SGNH/GDSL hydrolase family protein [Paenibacillus pasadenensis]MCM3746604.1 SGNH/GDSL hydrolase family protein [Paenibacillus pasadenensis]
MTKKPENLGERNEDGMTLEWHSPLEQPFHIAGFAWFDKERLYRRLPLTRKLPPMVDMLAGNTAGGQIRFQTNSPCLSVKVRLSGAANMGHMPATGQCGFDCYIGNLGEQKYFGSTLYDHTRQEYEISLYKKHNGSPRNITLYFPLYMGVEEVLIGLDSGSDVSPPPAYSSDRKIVLYGTSITQGACASRPGMAYPNILSRSINAEFYNLGFSGSGKGEAEVAEVIGEIGNPGLLVLDYEANCVSPELLRDTLPEFIRIYRRRHPKIPILVLSQIRSGLEHFVPEQLELRMKRKQIQRTVVETYRATGDRHIHFCDGGELLGEDYHDCTVDGIHPTDLGFQRMAERLAPVIDQLYPWK